MDSKHLATGSPFPPLQEGKVRFYSMRFCPYAHKTLLVAAHKGIPLDIVNVNLKFKPEWLFERNPTGKVPTIETPKGPLYESGIVAEYLDEVFPNKKLTPADPYQKALDNIWVENSNQIAGAYFKLTFGVSDDKAVTKEQLKELAETLKPFETELKRRGTLFFGGSQPKLIDYLIWPWFERIPLLKLMYPNLYNYEEGVAQKPHLHSWLQAMKEDEAVKSIYLAPEIYLEHLKSYKPGPPDYELVHKKK